MGDREGERAAASPRTGDASETTVCDHCRAAIDTSDWYPIAKDRDADGTLRFYCFCDDECRDAWREERSA